MFLLEGECNKHKEEDAKDYYGTVVVPSPPRDYHSHSLSLSLAGHHHTE